MENKVKQVKVTDEFVNIYKNFNVINQVEEMKKLSKTELYLLLTLTVDKIPQDDPVAKINWNSFREEMLTIFSLQDDQDVENDSISQLTQETGDKYIETDHLVDQNGDNLPTPLTKDQVRDKKIEFIQNKFDK